MLESVIQKTRLELQFLKKDLSKVIQGYHFGKYLVNDIKQRTQLISEEISYPLNNIALVTQLGEYQLAWDDVMRGEGNLYSCGVVIYGLTHRRDDKFIDDFYNNLKKHIIDSEVLSK